MNGSQVASELILGNALSIFNQNMSAVDYLVTGDLAATVVNDRQRTVAVHCDAFALTAFDRLQRRCT